MGPSLAITGSRDLGHKLLLWRHFFTSLVFAVKALVYAFIREEKSIVSNRRRALLELSPSSLQSFATRDAKLEG